MLDWATAAEVDNYGFNLYRAPANDFAQATWIHFEPSAIQGGTGAGATYAYLDTPPGHGAWWYWLADIDTHGIQTRNTPSVTITMRLQLPNLSAVGSDALAIATFRLKEYSMNRHMLAYLFVSLTMVALVFGSLPLATAETLERARRPDRNPHTAADGDQHICANGNPHVDADEHACTDEHTDANGNQHGDANEHACTNEYTDANGNQHVGADEHVHPGSDRHGYPNSRNHDRPGSCWFARHGRCCATEWSCSLEPVVARSGR